jgi:hypothetical protein
VNATPRPDWVIAGSPTDDGRVMVIASRRLRHATLREDTGYDEYMLSPLLIDAIRRPRNPRYTLEVEMADFIMVIGDTYQDAMRNLFNEWQPRHNEQPAIDARKAIEP